MAKFYETTKSVKKTITNNNKITKKVTNTAKAVANAVTSVNTTPTVTNSFVPRVNTSTSKQSVATAATNKAAEAYAQPYTAQAKAAAKKLETINTYAPITQNQSTAARAVSKALDNFFTPTATVDIKYKKITEPYKPIATWIKKHDRIFISDKEYNKQLGKQENEQLAQMVNNLQLKDANGYVITISASMLNNPQIKQYVTELLKNNSELQKQNSQTLNYLKQAKLMEANNMSDEDINKKIQQCVEVDEKITKAVTTAAETIHNYKYINEKDIDYTIRQQKIKESNKAWNALQSKFANKEGNVLAADEFSTVGVMVNPVYQTAFLSGMFKNSVYTAKAKKNVAVANALAGLYNMGIGSGRCKNVQWIYDESTGDWMCMRYNTAQNDDSLVDMNYDLFTFSDEQVKNIPKENIITTPTKLNFYYAYNTQLAYNSALTVNALKTLDCTQYDYTVKDFIDNNADYQAFINAYDGLPWDDIIEQQVEQTVLSRIANSDGTILNAQLHSDYNRAASSINMGAAFGLNLLTILGNVTDVVPSVVRSFYRSGYIQDASSPSGYRKDYSFNELIRAIDNPDSTSYVTHFEKMNEMQSARCSHPILYGIGLDLLTDPTVFLQAVTGAGKLATKLATKTKIANNVVTDISKNIHKVSKINVKRLTNHKFKIKSNSLKRAATLIDNAPNYVYLKASDFNEDALKYVAKQLGTKSTTELLNKYDAKEIFTKILQLNQKKLTNILTASLRSDVTNMSEKLLDEVQGEAIKKLLSVYFKTTPSGLNKFNIAFDDAQFITRLNKQYANAYNIYQKSSKLFSKAQFVDDAYTKSVLLAPYLTVYGLRKGNTYLKTLKQQTYKSAISQITNGAKEVLSKAYNDYGYVTNVADITEQLIKKMQPRVTTPKLSKTPKQYATDWGIEAFSKKTNMLLAIITQNNNISINDLIDGLFEIFTKEATEKYDIATLLSSLEGDLIKFEKMLSKKDSQKYIPALKKNIEIFKDTYQNKVLTGLYTVLQVNFNDQVLLAKPTAFITQCISDIKEYQGLLLDDAEAKALLQQLNNITKGNYDIYLPDKLPKEFKTKKAYATYLKNTNPDGYLKDAVNSFIENNLVSKRINDLKTQQFTTAKLLTETNTHDYINAYKMLEDLQFKGSKSEALKQMRDDVIKEEVASLQKELEAYLSISVLSKDLDFTYVRIPFEDYVDLQSNLYMAISNYNFTEAEQYLYNFIKTHSLTDETKNSLNTLASKIHDTKRKYDKIINSEIHEINVENSAYTVKLNLAIQQDRFHADKTYDTFIKSIIFNTDSNIPEVQDLVQQYKIISEKIDSQIELTNLEESLVSLKNKLIAEYQFYQILNQIRADKKIPNRIKEHVVDHLYNRENALTAETFFDGLRNQLKINVQDKPRKLDNLRQEIKYRGIKSSRKKDIQLTDEEITNLIDGHTAGNDARFTIYALFKLNFKKFVELNERVKSGEVICILDTETSSKVVDSTKINSTGVFVWDTPINVANQKDEYSIAKYLLDKQNNIKDFNVKVSEDQLENFCKDFSFNIGQRTGSADPEINKQFASQFFLAETPETTVTEDQIISETYSYIQSLYSASGKPYVCSWNGDAFDIPILRRNDDFRNMTMNWYFDDLYKEIVDKSTYISKTAGATLERYIRRLQGVLSEGNLESISELRMHDITSDLRQLVYQYPVPKIKNNLQNKIEKDLDVYEDLIPKVSDVEDVNSLEYITREYILKYNNQLSDLITEFNSFKFTVVKPDDIDTDIDLYLLHFAHNPELLEKSYLTNLINYAGTPYVLQDTAYIQWYKNYYNVSLLYNLKHPNNKIDFLEDDFVLTLQRQADLNAFCKGQPGNMLRYFSDDNLLGFRKVIRENAKLLYTSDDWNAITRYGSSAKARRSVERVCRSVERLKAKAYFTAQELEKYRQLMSDIFYKIQKSLTELPVNSPIYSEFFGIDGVANVWTSETLKYLNFDILGVEDQAAVVISLLINIYKSDIFNEGNRIYKDFFKTDSPIHKVLSEFMDDADGYYSSHTLSVNNIFDKDLLIPILREKGFTESEASFLNLCAAKYHARKNSEISLAYYLKNKTNKNYESVIDKLNQLTNNYENHLEYNQNFWKDADKILGGTNLDTQIRFHNLRSYYESLKCMKHWLEDLGAAGQSLYARVQDISNELTQAAIKDRSSELKRFILEDEINALRLLINTPHSFIQITTDELDFITALKTNKYITCIEQSRDNVYKIIINKNNKELIKKGDYWYLNNKLLNPLELPEYNLRKYIYDRFTKEISKKTNSLTDVSELTKMQTLLDDVFETISILKHYSTGDVSIGVLELEDIKRIYDLNIAETGIDYYNFEDLMSGHYHKQSYSYNFNFSTTGELSPLLGTKSFKGSNILTEAFDTLKSFSAKCDDAAAYAGLYVNTQDVHNANRLYEFLGTDEAILKYSNNTTDCVWLAAIKDDINEARISEILNKIDKFAADSKEYKALHSELLSRRNYQMKIIDVNNLKDVETIKRLDACFVPRAIAENAMSAINYYTPINPVLRTAQKYMILMKSSYLVKLGTGIRNWLDETIKTIQDVGYENAPQVLKSQLTAIYQFNNYNKIMDAIKKQTQSLVIDNTLASKLYYSKNIRVYIDNADRVFKDLDYDTFMHIHNFMTSGASGVGDAGTIRKYILKNAFSQPNKLHEKYNISEPEPAVKPEKSQYAMEKYVDEAGNWKYRRKKITEQAKQSEVKVNVSKKIETIPEEFYTNNTTSTLKAAIQAGAPLDATTKFAFDTLTSTMLKPMEASEQFTRYAHYTVLKDMGLTNFETYNRLSKTHFNYNIKDRATTYAEIFLPFMNFQKLNLDYWSRLFISDPRYIHNFIRYSNINDTVGSVSSDTAIAQEEYDCLDNPYTYVNTYKVDQYLNGAMILPDFLNRYGQDGYLKLNPSFYDAFAFFSQPINKLLGTFFSPLQTVIQKLGSFEQLAAQGIWEGSYNNGVSSLIPIYGSLLKPAYQSAQTFMNRALDAKGNEYLNEDGLFKLLFSMTIPSILGLDSIWASKLTVDQKIALLNEYGLFKDYITGEWKPREECVATTKEEAHIWYYEHGYQYNFVLGRYVWLGFGSNVAEEILKNNPDLSPEDVEHYNVPSFYTWEGFMDWMIAYKHQCWDYVSQSFIDINTPEAIFDPNVYATYMENQGFVYDYITREWINPDTYDKAYATTYQEAAEYMRVYGKEWDYVRKQYVTTGTAIANSYKAKVAYFANMGYVYDTYRKQYVPKELAISPGSEYPEYASYSTYDSFDEKAEAMRKQGKGWNPITKQWVPLSEVPSFEDYEAYMKTQGKGWDPINKKWVPISELPSFNTYQKYMESQGYEWDYIWHKWTPSGTAEGKSWQDYYNYCELHNVTWDYDTKKYTPGYIPSRRNKKAATKIFKSKPSKNFTTNKNSYVYSAIHKYINRDMPYARVNVRTMPSLNLYQIYPTRYNKLSSRVRASRFLANYYK